MGAKASLHMQPMKSFDGAQSNENERRGWDRERYTRPEDYKGATNHYDWFRRHLNFEIVKGKIVPQLSQSIPLHERLQNRLKELGFKHYKVTAKITPNICMDFMIGGNRERLREMAFGNQSVNFEKPDEKNSHITRCSEIERWAMDTYRWAANKYGEENIIGFNVHLDETTPHVHMQVIPVGEVTKRGRVKAGEQRGTKKTVSFAAVVGKTKEEYSKYKDHLHTDYHLQVGYKYGLERGTFFDDLTPEEQALRQHRNKAEYILYDKTMKKVEEAKKEAAAIVDGANKEATTIVAKAHKDAGAIRQGVDDDLKSLQIEMKKADIRLKGLNTMISNLEERRDHLEIDIAALEDEYDNGRKEAGKELERLNKQLAEINAKIEEKNGKLSVATEQYNNLAMRNMELEDQINSISADAAKEMEWRKDKMQEVDLAIQEKRAEVERIDKTGELDRAHKHIEERESILYRRWSEAQAAVKAIFQFGSSPTAKGFTPQQALDVEHAIVTSCTTREKAAGDLLSLAKKDFDNHRTPQAWVDTAAKGVMSIAHGTHQRLTSLLKQQPKDAGGGPSYITDLTDWAGNQIHR